MASKMFIILLAATPLYIRCQRPPFAGSKPIGYPHLYDRTTTLANELGNKFGEGDATSTTQRLPIEANGDKELVDRLSKLPVDQQPFWLINWQALEAHRQKPQNYPQRPSPFAESVSNAGETSPTPQVINMNTANGSPVSNSRVQSRSGVSANSEGRRKSMVVNNEDSGKQKTSRSNSNFSQDRNSHLSDIDRQNININTRDPNYDHNKEMANEKTEIAMGVGIQNWSHKLYPHSQG